MRKCANSNAYSMLVVRTMQLVISTGV